MKRFQTASALFILLLMGRYAFPAGNSLYSYVDESGTLIFTNIGYRGNQGGDIEIPAPSLGIDSKRISADAVYYEDIIRQYASPENISEDLIKAMIQVESNYDPYAVSIKNCKGLMQLHPDTARRFGVENIYNPEENIAGGIRYLSFLLENFDNNLNCALAAYNSGENTVRKYNGVPPYPETINYVNKVKSLAGLADRPETPAPRPVRINRFVDGDGNVTLTNY